MSRLVIALIGLLAAGLAGTARAGSETFANFSYSGSTYTNGTFVGQDGSTWTYFQCRGNKFINAPTPGLNKGTNLAYVASGTITGGCGNLSFDWMQMFTASVRVDVVINGTVRQTIEGGGQNITNHIGDLAINQAGNFTLMIRQNNKDAGQVAIDNLSWTTYGGAAPEHDQPGQPGAQVRPAIDLGRALALPAVELLDRHPQRRRRGRKAFRRRNGIGRAGRSRGRGGSGHAVHR